MTDAISRLPYFPSLATADQLLPRRRKVSKLDEILSEGIITPLGNEKPPTTLTCWLTEADRKMMKFRDERERERKRKREKKKEIYKERKRKRKKRNKKREKK